MITEHILRKRLQDAFVNPSDYPDSSNNDPEEESDSIPEETDPSENDSEESMARAEPIVPPNTSVDVAAPTKLTPPDYPPETQAYINTIKNEPKHADYHASGKRKFGAALAGIGTGLLTMSPAVGQEEYSQVKDAPYRSKLQDYGQDVEQGKTLSGIESGTMSAQSKMREEEARRQAELARRGAEESRGRRYDWLTGSTAQQYKLEQLKVQHPGTPNKKYVPIGAGGLLDTETGQVVQGTKPPKEAMNEFQLWHQQNPEAKAEDYPGLSHNVSEYSDFKVGYLQKHPGANSTEIVNAYAAAHQEPQRTPPITGFSGGKVVALRPGQEAPKDFQTGTQAGQTNTPTTFFRGRQESAKVAIDAGNNLINFVQQNKQALGQVDNYWKQLVQGTPVADPTVSHFIGQVQSWAALQGAAHGMRSGTIMKEFEDRLGKGPKSPEAVISAIQGVNEGLASVAGSPTSAQPGQSGGVPKIGETFNGSKVKAVKQIK